MGSGLSAFPPWAFTLENMRVSAENGPIAQHSRGELVAPMHGTALVFQSSGMVMSPFYSSNTCHLCIPASKSGMQVEKEWMNGSCRPRKDAPLLHERSRRMRVCRRACIYGNRQVPVQDLGWWQQSHRVVTHIIFAIAKKYGGKLLHYL